MLSCAESSAAKDDAPVRTAGVFLIRLRPGKGNAVFITIEDETGITNALRWSRDMELQRRAVTAARLMIIEGEVQRSKENVVHLMAKRVIDASEMLKQLADESPEKLAPPVSTGVGGDPDARHHTYRGHPRNTRVLPRSRDFH